MFQWFMGFWLFQCSMGLGCFNGLGGGGGGFKCLNGLWGLGVSLDNGDWVFQWTMVLECFIGLRWIWCFKRLAALWQLRGLPHPLGGVSLSAVRDCCISYSLTFWVFELTGCFGVFLLFQWTSWFWVFQWTGRL